MEYYHIIEIERLPLKKVTSLFFGLPQNSRTKSKLNGLTVPLDTFLLAQQVDALNMLVWTKTKDAEKGRNKPKSISESFLIKDIEKDVRGFETGSDFERALQKIKERSD